MAMPIALAFATELEVATPVCRPSRVVAQTMRAYCDRTDGDRHADHGCHRLWEALRSCAPHLKIERRRDTITIVLNDVDWWTMVLQRRDTGPYRVVAFHWEDCCECPADPWFDPRLTSNSD